MSTRPRLDDQSGLTLIEMLVTTMIVTILGGLIFSAVLGMNRAVSVADNTSFDQAFGRNALTLISRDVRAATEIQLSDEPAFATATTDEVAFTALLGTGLTPDLVRVRVDSQSRILVTQTPADPSSNAPNLVYSAADEAERYVASFVVNDRATPPTPLYRYFDETGTELDDFTGTGGNLTKDERKKIASVEITLLLNRAPLITGASRLTTTVRLPNAGARN